MSHVAVNYFRSELANEVLPAFGRRFEGHAVFYKTHSLRVLRNNSKILKDK